MTFLLLLLLGIVEVRLEPSLAGDRLIAVSEGEADNERSARCALSEKLSELGWDAVVNRIESESADSYSISVSRSATGEEPDMQTVSEVEDGACRTDR